MDVPSMSADDKSPEQPSPPPSIALSVAAVAGLIAVVLRIVPHPPNFSSVGALGLFGCARLRGWQACVFLMGSLMVSDMLLWTLTGFDEKYWLGHLSRPYVYASFLLYIPIGRWLMRRTTIASIALASSLGALQFFLVTNFCEWLFQPWQPYYDQLPEVYRYSRDLSGLATCFTIALPFYQNDLPFTPHPFMLFRDFRLSLAWTYLGDVIFSTVYLLAFAKLAKLSPVSTTAIRA
jgi:hypothetical protein